MEAKKNPKANLEHLKQIFLLSGLIIGLGIVVMAFNWRSSNAQANDLGTVNISVDEELAEITRLKEPTPPKPEPPQQQKQEIIKIVTNTEDTPEIEFTSEMDEDDEIVLVEKLEGEDNETLEIPVVIAEKMPEYPGGELAMRRDIVKNVNYPALARENDVQGTVYLRFVVLKSGKVGKVQIIRGVDPMLDEEAIKVVKTLRKFKPGMQGGKKVKVWFSMPINFKLN